MVFRVNYSDNKFAVIILTGLNCEAIVNTFEKIKKLMNKTFRAVQSQTFKV